MDPDNFDFEAFNESTISEFRAHRGQARGQQLLLLTTTGDKSGKSRTNPLV